MKARLSERDVLSALLKNLDLPYKKFQLDRTADVITLGLSASEWDEVKQIVSKSGVDEIGEAWRELPPLVWMDESWIERVCVRVCQFAPDYAKLILQPACEG